MEPSALRNCYNEIAKLGNELEPFSVIEAVAAHRDYWRPKRTNVILLAESHVWTNVEDFASEVDVRPFGLQNYPKNYVRLVYNLAYGENSLLKAEVSPNPGTWQYWRIFYSCCNRVSSNADCAPVLKSGNRVDSVRLRDKVRLLQEMQGQGIWLMDASIVALYRPGAIMKPLPETMRALIELSWEHYLEGVVTQLRPKHVICIGAQVFNTLNERLARTVGFDKVSHIAQPQARLGREEHMQNLVHCFDICSRYSDNRVRSTHA